MAEQQYYQGPPQAFPQQGFVPGYGCPQVMMTTPTPYHTMYEQNLALQQQLHEKNMESEKQKHADKIQKLKDQHAIDLKQIRDDYEKKCREFTELKEKYDALNVKYDTLSRQCSSYAKVTGAGDGTDAHPVVNDGADTHLVADGAADADVGAVVNDGDADADADADADVGKVKNKICTLFSTGPDYSIMLDENENSILIRHEFWTNKDDLQKLHRGFILIATGIIKRDDNDNLYLDGTVKLLKMQGIIKYGESHSSSRGRDRGRSRSLSPHSKRSFFLDGYDSKRYLFVQFNELQIPGYPIFENGIFYWQDVIDGKKKKSGDKINFSLQITFDSNRDRYGIRCGNVVSL